MPGYISLFQRNNETLGIAKNITENADDHFEELLVSIEKDVNKNRYDVKNPKYRKRTVNTVWYWTDMYLCTINSFSMKNNTNSKLTCPNKIKMFGNSTWKQICRKISAKSSAGRAAVVPQWRKTWFFTATTMVLPRPRK